MIKEKDYFMNLANAYPGGAGIALEMSAISDYEIQQKYGNQMTLIEDRTFVINQNSPFVDTIMLRLIILMHWEMQLVEYVQVGFEINMLILQWILDQIQKQIRCLIILHFYRPALIQEI